MRRILATGMLSIWLFAGSEFIGADAPAIRAAQDGPARAPSANAPSANAPSAGTDGDDEKLRLVAERFLVVLEKTPRKGTALDRLYGYHVEAGSLEQFVKQFAGRTLTNAQDGSAWMILGLLESQRGNDSAAVAAFAQAETTLPENALAPFYLGQSLVQAGQPEAAAAAFERAIARKPQRADLLDMFQALGRVYQRAQKTDQALAVWSRLEKLFPDDLRVQEQIATTLIEEGQHPQALPRFEALARQVKDEYRAATYRIEAADLKVRLGQSPEALADFELLLAKLNPDHWLYRDVRRRIDEVFLRTDDQTGLAAYYETWMDRHADDVEAMGRLARILAGLGRTPESQAWLDKALKLAPSRKDLRLALIEQFLADKQFGMAIAQYELLAKNDPNNPDILREWGRLILKDSSRPAAERNLAAAAIWRKLLEARPKDSLTATQVADLFRQSNLPDEALELYQKAVDLSPDATQYREYLGEYYHTLKRSDEALATWREIAGGKTGGKKRTAENLARLAEVLAGFGYLDEAVSHMLEACRLDRGEFKYPLKAADLLSRSEKYAEALKQLDAAQKLADSPESSELVLQQRIRNLQLADRLEAQAAQLQHELAAEKDQAAAERWYLLARYLEAARKLPEADQAIGRALALDEKSIVYRAAAARIAEASGNLQGAADAYRTLASIDRRYRTEHLTNVAKLETQLGRSVQALQAGRDLLAAAPGNPENYEFFAQLCFQLGKTEDGLDALRRSVRLNPTEARAMLTLAAALSDQFRIDEAIEMYWRAFEKSADIEAKLAVVQKLADLSLQTNHFDRLVERFERGRREASQERELTICLAQAHQTAGDYGTARQELERLLLQNPRDTQLLQQLSKLAESEGDLHAATKFEQQLAAAAPGKENQHRLAQLLLRSGETDQALALWDDLAASEEDPARLVATLDNLLSHNRRETLLAITGRLLLRDPENWELLYREGAALAKNKPAEAVERFCAILALRVADDEPGTQSRDSGKSKGARPATAAPRAGGPSQMLPVRNRIAAAYKVRAVVGLESDLRVAIGTTVWGPEDFGQARLAALAWLLKLSGKSGAEPEFLAELHKPLDNPAVDARGLWDWCYLQIVRQNDAAVAEAARRLAGTGDPLGQWLYLAAVTNRAAGGRSLGTSVLASQNMVSSAGNLASALASRSAVGNTATIPLAADELDDLVVCFQALRQKRPDLLTGANSTIIADVLAQLNRAGRTDDAQAIYDSLVAEARRSDPNQAEASRFDARMSALQLTAAKGDVTVSLEFFDKIADYRLAHARLSGQAGETGADVLAVLMASRAAQGAPEDLLTILERYFVFSQRRKQTEVVTPGVKKPRPVRNVRIVAGQMVQIQMGRSLRAVRVDFPLANEYFDLGAITLLKQADELYRLADLTPELFDHARRCAATPDRAERLWWQLALAYLSWWHNDPDQAVSEMARAVDLAPGDAALALELAGMCERRQDPASALAIADAVVPRDHQMLHERENLALRLALATGQLDRAREAAERLIGLRLGVAEQVQLVASLKQLGMNDESRVLMSRARRNAGNSVEALGALMRQYQSEQKLDQAVLVARQILKRGTTSRSGVGRGTATGGPVKGGPVNGSANVGGIRQQALQVLVQAGQIEELIERTEAQLRAAPASSSLMQSLAELYQAAGRQSKIEDILARELDARPDDAALRLQIAQQLARAGKHDLAVDHYLVAFKQDPALFGQYAPIAMQTFRQANRTADLAAIFETVDFSALGQAATYRILMQLFQPMMGDATVALRTLRRAWDDLSPVYRQQLLIQLNLRNNQAPYRVTPSSGRDLRGTPEMYELLHHAVLSDTPSAHSWGGTDQVLNGVVRGQNGPNHVESLVSWLIDAAGKDEKRLADLQEDVEERLKAAPDRCAGKVILAVIHSRAGQPELARPLVEQLLADAKNPIPAGTCWILGQELDQQDQTRALAVTLYERWFEHGGRSLVNLNGGPIELLVAAYQKDARPEKAREILLKIHANVQDDRYDAGTAAYLRIQNATHVGQQLMNLGYAVDAYRVYSYSPSPQELADMARMLNVNFNPFLKQLQMGLENARMAILGKHLASSLAVILEPQREATPHAEQPVGQPDGRQTGRQVERPAGQPAVDLLLRIEPRNLPGIQLASATAEALRAAANANSEIELKQSVETRISELASQFPDDPSVQVIAALWALADRQPEASRESVERLLALVSRLPLERLPAGARPTVGQRAAAERWIGLWLVARECMKSDDLQAEGATLARRAVDAARRQLDPRHAVAILREWGQLAIERGDLQGTETHWSEIVELSLPSPGRAATKPAAVAETDKVEAATETPAVARLLMSRGPTLPVPTLEQFNQVAEVSKMAATNKLTGLALRSIRDALQAGPPLAPPPLPDQPGGAPAGVSGNATIVRTTRTAQRTNTATGSPAGGDRDNQVAPSQSVEWRLPKIVQTWNEAGIPRADQYETLAAVVFPEGRPTEICLYARPSAAQGQAATESMPRLLVDAAVQAGRVDDLKKRIAERQKGPQPTTAAKTLLSLLPAEAVTPPSP